MDKHKGKIIWQSDIDGMDECYYITDKYEILFGYSVKELITFEDLEEHLEIVENDLPANTIEPTKRVIFDTINQYLILTRKEKIKNV